MTVKRQLLAVVASVCVLAATAGAAQADFRDGTIFPDTAANGRLDAGPVFVFRSPANANNTVFVLPASPFTGVLTPTTFVKGARYDIAIDRTGDAVEDMVLRTTFGPPSSVDGSQSVLLRCLPKPRCFRYVLARGRTGQNLAIRGGGTFRAADQDNPVFFDQGGWDSFISTGMAGFPRPVGTAHNFYGPNGNALAITIELPSAHIPSIPANPNKIIGVWARTIADGGQRDREGQPFVNTGLIPKVPRNASGSDLRDAFNAARPQNDVSAFTTPLTSVLTSAAGPYKRSMADAAFLATAYLPDVAMFQIGNPNGFGTTIGPGPGIFTGPFPGGQVLGNGHRFRDDVHDISLNLLTQGAIPSDNVGDDNGLKITDGSVDPVSGKTRAVAFPYIGPPNSPAGGANP